MRQDVLRRDGFPLNTGNSSRLSSWQQGFDIWSSIGSGVRNAIVVAPTTAPGRLDSKDLLNKNLNWLSLACVVIFVGLAAVPLAVIICCCCLNRPVTKTITQSTRSYLTIVGLLLIVTSSLIALITGIEASFLITSALKSTKATADTLILQGQATVSILPNISRSAVANVSSNAQNVVDSVYGIVDIGAFQTQLVGPNGTGPAELLISTSSDLMDGIQKVRDEAASLDAQINQLAAALTRLKTDLSLLSQNMTKLNGPLPATTQKNIYYKLRNTFPTDGFAKIDEALSNMTGAVGEFVKTPVSSRLKQLDSIPDLSAVRTYLAPVVDDLRATVERLVTDPVKAEVAERIQNASVSAVQGVDDFALSAGVQLGTAGSTVSDQGEVVRRYDGMRATVAIAALALSSFTVALVVVFVVLRLAPAMKITVFLLAFSSFFLLMLAAISFASTGAAGEVCTVATDKDARFLSAVNVDLGTKFRNFHSARAACLDGRATSLVDVALTLGVSPSALNLTQAAVPVIEGYNFSSYTTINIGVIIPDDVQSVARKLDNYTSGSVASSLSFGKLTDLDSFNASAIMAATSKLQSSIQSLQTAQNNSPNDVLAAVAPVNASAKITVDDLASLTAALEQTLAAQAQTDSDVQIVQAFVASLRLNVSAANDTVLGVQSLPQLLKSLYDQVFDMTNAFTSSASRNLTAFIPTIKQQLYNVTDTAMDNVKARLECTAIMGQTQNLQNYACRDLTQALDALWLSFLTSGASLFVCLSCMGCITNRLARRRQSLEGVDGGDVDDRLSGRPDAEGNFPSSDTLTSSTSLVGGGNGSDGDKSKRRHFGKSDPGIGNFKHPDEALLAD
ncbi:hypothetical protein DFJ73DRAFT_644429 [Zopfochytrium polystomum]|nr:hypothetical protein DFJ73DRAFT_644429 [Zopfochytrium polystomum]